MMRCRYASTFVVDELPHIGQPGLVHQDAAERLATPAMISTSLFVS
jgi:hypothetical protein